MRVDGRFSYITISDETDTVDAKIEDVPFIQDGFSFTAFVLFDNYPLFGEGDTVVGYIDDEEVARGSIQTFSPVMRDGEKYLRCLVEPFPHSHSSKATPKT
jgi:hypothetical protein